MGGAENLAGIDVADTEWETPALAPGAGEMEVFFAPGVCLLNT